MSVTLTSAFHEAHIDPIVGIGLLVRPSVVADVADPFGPNSAHLSDMLALMARLPGWSISADDFGDAILVGRLADGHEAISLIAGIGVAVVDDPAMERVMDAEEALVAELGIVRCAPGELPSMDFVGTL